MDTIKIDERTFKFSLQIIKLYKHLKTEHEYIMSKQLLRAGTSIGAYVEEAQAAQSRRDFISKMSIASKEARESKYWIRLLAHSGHLDNYTESDKLLNEVNNIVNIITKIVKSTQEREN